VKFPKFLKFRKIEQKCESCGLTSSDVTRASPTDKFLCPKCHIENERAELNNALCQQTLYVPLTLKNALEQLALDINIEKQFLTEIHRTIKNDEAVISDNIHCALSAYFDPFNLAHKGKSSSGKTYVTTGSIEYFPDEDVVVIGSQSPKVISHDYGELMTIDENGTEIPLNMDDAPHKPTQREYDGKEEFSDAYDAYKIYKKQWDQKIKNIFHLIRLTGKIYVFLDTISQETFEMFKCTLSHDKKRIIHKYVDEKSMVHTTVLEGWPAAIFCTVDKSFIEEFATRTFTDTPESSTEKIQAAQEVTDNKRSFPWQYDEDTKEKKLLKALILNIKDTVKKYNLKTVKPFPNLRNAIKFSNIDTRDMRDYDHFNQMLPTYTAFKLFQRPIITIGKQKYIVESIDDVLAALELFEKIAETTRTGTEKLILDFYHNHVQSHKEGATLKTILADSPEMKSERSARYYLTRLEELGWINITEGEQADKRLLTYHPLKDTTETQQKLIPTTANQQIAIVLRLELEKDFKTWIKTITTTDTSYALTKINFLDRTETPISMEEFDRMVIGENEQANRQIQPKQLPLDTENKIEENNNIHTESNPTLPNPSQENKNVRVGESRVVIVSNDENKAVSELEAETMANQQIATDALISVDNKKNSRTLEEMMNDEENAENG
jgi:hypothetical protein